MAITLALWALYEFAGPQAWWAELLRYLPYPLYLAPAALALAASLQLGWPWRGAAALALGLVVFDVMGFSWGRGDNVVDTAAVRLMTWNAKSYSLRWADHHARVAREIVEHAPDVLVLQDVPAYGDPAVPLPKPLQAALRDRAVFRHGQYLVASRFPMRDCRAVDMTVASRTEDYVRCMIDVHGREIDLVDVHLVSPRSGLNAARREGLDGLDEWKDNYRERLAQAAALQRDLSGNARPVVVAGDLNAVEVSPVIRTLKALDLRDAFARGGLGWGYTLGHSLRTRFSFLRIDHVLVGPAIGVRDCFVGGADASEHRPVIADLLVPPR